MTWLGSLPAWAIFPLFTAAALLAAVAFNAILRRWLVPEEYRSNVGPSAATTLQVVATIYAVLVAFVIVDEYGQLRDAQNQVSTKAAELTVVYENAGDLTAAQGDTVRGAALAYARAEVRQGLPELARTGKPSATADAAFLHIYRLLARIEPRTESDKVAYQQILTAMGAVSQTRSNLLNSSRATIPTSLFVVLAVLGAAILAVGSLIDTRHRRSHFLMLTALAIGLATTLALVAALDYPYRGFIHIDTAPLSQFIQERAAR